MTEGTYRTTNFDGGTQEETVEVKVKKGKQKKDAPNMDDLKKEAEMVNADQRVNLQTLYTGRASAECALKLRQ